MFYSLEEKNDIPVYPDIDSIILSEEQEKVLNEVVSFVEDENKRKYFVVSGFAGTGKSAIIPFIRNKISGQSAVIAYTGKAVIVLKRKGISDAQTIHSFLYHTKITTDEKTQKLKYEFIKKGEYDFENIKCVLVDESSMIDENIFNELVSHNFKIVFFGDSFQLPPVKDKFNIMEKPDVQLTKILRQNENNPIVKLSFMARTHQEIPFGNFGNSSKNPLFKLKPDKLLQFNQIICWTNRKRNEINNSIRSFRGYNLDTIYEGEKLVVKANYRYLGLFNGQMVINTKDSEVSPIKSNKSKIYHLNFVDEVALDDIIAACTYGPVTADCTIGLSAEEIFNIKINSHNKKPLVHLDYGYAITCHSAQGSSWPYVCIIEENGLRKMDEYWRWLYTAITRAEERVEIFSTGGIV